jgi:hypothetical protein
MNETINFENIFISNLKSFKKFSKIKNAIELLKEKKSLNLKIVFFSSFMPKV